VSSTPPITFSSKPLRPAADQKRAESSEVERPPVPHRTGGTTLERPRLIELLCGTNNVMLCAPSGYGQSTLLQQYAETDSGAVLLKGAIIDSLGTLAESVVPGARNLADVARSGVTTLLIDDAHLYPVALVNALIKESLDTPGFRVIVSVRHTEYWKFQTMLRKGTLRVMTNKELAFTRAEAELFEHGLDNYALHLGWPCIVSNQESAHFKLNTVLSEMVQDLPLKHQRELRTAAGSQTWPSLILDWQLGQHLETVANTGFPLIEKDNELSLHPLMARHLTGTEVILPVPQINGNSEALKTHLMMAERSNDPATTKLIVERYFSQYGDHEETRAGRIQLLSMIPRNELPPAQRDRLAELLVNSGRMTDALQLLDQQRSLSLATANTYVNLARIAYYSNNLNDMQLYVGQAEQLAQNDSERCVILNLRSLMETRTGSGDSLRALQLAEQSRELAIRSQSLTDELKSYSYIVNANHSLGRLEVAALTVEEGIRRVEIHQQHTELLINLLVAASELYKDLGRYDDALQAIQRALTFSESNGLNTSFILPYAYLARGLAYLELRQDDDAIASLQFAIEGFEATENQAGILSPYAFLAYAQWRKNWTESVSETRTAVQRLNDRTKRGSADVGWLAFVPLIEGIYFLSAGDPDRALKEFRKIWIDGYETYDSVLLCMLFICKLELRSGHFPDEDVNVLIDLLDFRPQALDTMLAAYAADFADVIEAMIDHGVSPERFRKVLGTTKPKQRRKGNKKAPYTITVKTMTTAPFIAINGEPLDIPTLYPVYTLSYLILKHAEDPEAFIGSEELAKDLYGERKTNAQSSVSLLRTALTSRDQELERDLLSPRSDRRGYRLALREHITVHLDVTDYLSDMFDPVNPDKPMLQTMLRNFQPFLQRRRTTRRDTTYIENLNHNLKRRALGVAHHLREEALKRGDWYEAALALALYLQFDLDYEVMDLLKLTIPADHSASPLLDRLRAESFESDDDDETKWKRSLDQLSTLLSIPGNGIVH